MTDMVGLMRAVRFLVSSLNRYLNTLRVNVLHLSIMGKSCENSARMKIFIGNTSNIVIKNFRIFSVDSNIIPLDNSVSDSTHNTVVYDQRKNQLLNNSSLMQRSLSDIYVAFK